MRKVTCMCETTFDADLPEQVDLDADPGVVDQILAGEFLSVSCPSCGSRLKPELPVRLVSKKRALDLVFLPELDRMAVYRGAADLPKGAQVLIGYPELFERARVIADGMDPEAVEIVKYYLQLKAEEQAGEAEVAVSYAGMDGGKLTFHVRGVKEGEVAVLHVGRDTYDRTLADKARSLRAEPFDRILAGPYKSIRMLEAED